MSKKYSLKEAASYTGLSVNQLKHAIQIKQLNAEREKISDKGFKYIIDEEDLLAYQNNTKNKETADVPKEQESESEEKTDNKYEEALTNIKVLEDKLKDYEDMEEQNEQLSRELELANNDFEQQVKEFEALQKDYEKLEEKKKRQDELISEAEQSLLDMVEQYKDLAKDIHERDQKINKLTGELEEIKRKLISER